MRRAIGVHLVPEGARFSDRPGGHIHRRCRRTGDPAMDESFFPVLWSREEGCRTAWIEDYFEAGGGGRSRGEPLRPDTGSG